MWMWQQRKRKEKKGNTASRSPADRQAGRPHDPPALQCPYLGSAPPTQDAHSAYPHPGEGPHMPSLTPAPRIPAPTDGHLQVAHSARHALAQALLHARCQLGHGVWHLTDHPLVFRSKPAHLQEQAAMWHLLLGEGEGGGAAGGKAAAEGDDCRALRSTPARPS